MISNLKYVISYFPVSKQELGGLQTLGYSITGIVVGHLGYLFGTKLVILFWFGNHNRLQVQVSKLCVKYEVLRTEIISSFVKRLRMVLIRKFKRPQARRKSYLLHTKRPVMA